MTKHCLVKQLVTIICLYFVLCVNLAWGEGNKKISDLTYNSIEELKKEILSIKGTAELNKFLFSHDLISEPNNMLDPQMGNTDNLNKFLFSHGSTSKKGDTLDLKQEERISIVGYEGELIEMKPEDLKVDLFFTNLFGDSQQEAILQLRFKNAIYFVNFFYFKSGKWHKIPSVIGIYPGDLAIYGDKSFVFKFEKVKNDQENAILGEVSGGLLHVIRGEEETLKLWQISEREIKSIFSRVVWSCWYSSPDPEPIEKPIHEDCSLIPNSKDVTYPKKMECIEYKWKAYCKGDTFHNDKRCDEPWKKDKTTVYSLKF